MVVSVTQRVLRDTVSSSPSFAPLSVPAVFDGAGAWVVCTEASVWAVSVRAGSAVVDEMAWVTEVAALWTLDTEVVTLEATVLVVDT